MRGAAGGADGVSNARRRGAGTRSDVSGRGEWAIECEAVAGFRGSSASRHETLQQASARSPTANAEDAEDAENAERSTANCNCLLGISAEGGVRRDAHTVL